MKYIFEVENIRCGGCSNTITKKLSEIQGVEEVNVNVEEKQVFVKTQTTNVNLQRTLSEKLKNLGYPEAGTLGSNNLRTKATSVVSCAIGKVSSKD